MSILLATPQPARHPAPTARASALSHLLFERPDLELAARFLTDFGLTVALRTEDELRLRGTAAGAPCLRIRRGSRARFVGAGFRVDDAADLIRLESRAGGVRLAGDGDGDGTVVALRDPAGFVVEVAHGARPLEPLASRPPIPIANVGDRRARVNATQRVANAPAEVVRLGHVVVEVADFQATCAWYTEHLGLIPSDVQVFDDGTPAVAFLRLDRGELPADHHTLALAQGVMPAFGHAAFEVVDVDAVGAGNRALRERAWTHAWGIGRHLLGSQVFDYWEDPWGARHEHYCDGDVFTAEVPCGVHPVAREAMAQWGPAMPRSFTKPRLTLAAIAATAANLRRSPDLSFRKLLTLARLFG